MIDFQELCERIEIRPLPPVIQVEGTIGAPDVRVRPGLMGQLEAIASASLHREIGGLLVGAARVDGDRLVIDVTGSLPAEQTDAGPAHLRFTHETWRLLRLRRQREYPDAVVVGWYHSHPGWGVFLSRYDQALHSQVFAAEPWCVALVIDPVHGEQGFFWSNRGQFLRCADQAITPQQQDPDGVGGADHGVPDAQG